MRAIAGRVKAPGQGVVLEVVPELVPGVVPQVVRQDKHRMAGNCKRMEALGISSERRRCKRKTVGNPRVWHRHIAGR